MRSKTLSSYAVKSFNTFNQLSVVQQFPYIIRECEVLLAENKPVYYVGVKNTNVIPLEYLEALHSHGFLVHTRDAMSDRGRAIDQKLINPITGRWMSGSSSGTALNVFYDINDLGIGTDGGGSVLAPAISLNLYGFISPLICFEALSQYSKKSTDNIHFQPSIGFISKTLEPMYVAAKASLDLPETLDLDLVIGCSENQIHKEVSAETLRMFPDSKKINLLYDSTSRQALMDELNEFDFETQILISFEGPVDLFEYGDSLMGHYSHLMKEKQQKSHKYYLTVVNMLGLSAIIIPTKELSVGILMICKSSENYINTMFDYAKKIKFERSELEQRYFSVENY